MALSAHKRNRNTLIWFISLLLVLLIIIDVIAINLQNTNLLESNKKHSLNELQLAGDFCVEALLKHDYVAVEQFLSAWAIDDDDTVSLQAVSANGFKILDYHRARPADHIIELEHDAVNSGRSMLKIKRAIDVSRHHDGLINNSVLLILGSIIIVSIFGTSLWIALRKTAIIPLQTEIEERIKAEKVLEKRTAELEGSNRELEAFSYSVSHDLRAPLRSMDGFSRALLDDYSDKLDEEGKDFLQRIRSAAGRMGSLIDDMLEMSRTTRAELKCANINLGDIAEIIALQLQNSDRERSVNFDVEKDLVLYGDKNLMAIVIENLISNAWKYTSQNELTEIKIGKMQVKDETVFYCKDNGVGFDLRYANKLFMPFQRLHGGNEFEGNGIGLATVERVINRHHGRIWAESAPGEGATFFFVVSAEAE